MTKKFYITTPIYYVNDVPHIGHACTTVVADIIARYHKLLGEKVFFLTGTDEHGAKVAEAARKENLSPKEFCDRVSQNFQEIWPKLDIEYDYFIRTTNPEHEKLVQEIIEKIYRKGDIYKAKYEGSYCVDCEKFVTETDLVNNKCPLHPNKEILKQSEDNYFFKLSKYAPLLVKAIEDPKDPNHYNISPSAKKEEVLSKLRASVGDLSISRANVSWGIPLPWDQTQTIYVWFDALLNYYTALKIAKNEGFWPADLHLIGKEILWFHAVIWEAMLLAADIPLPKEIFAHSFYMIDGQKMSKSLGNVIAPQELLEKFGVDGTRYLIASSFPYANDGDIGWQKFTEKYNADLANGLGNLVARVAKLCELKQVEIPEESLRLEPRLPISVADTYRTLMDAYQLPVVLEIIWREIKSLDVQVNNDATWSKPNDQVVGTIQNYVRQIKHLAFALKPFMPETAKLIEQQFSKKQIKSEPPLFPRI